MAFAELDRAQKGYLVSQETMEQKAILGNISCETNKYFSFV